MQDAFAMLRSGAVSDQQEPDAFALLRGGIKPPPELEGMARVKQDVRQATLAAGQGISNTVAAARKLAQPLTQVPDEVIEADRQSMFKLADYVAPNAPTQPYTPRPTEEALAGAAGTTLEMLAGGVAARGLNIGMKLAMGTLGASEGYGRGYFDAINEGATPEQAYGAAFLSAAGGSLEAYGGEAASFGRFFAKLDRRTGGAFRRLILEPAKEGATNAAQEGVQELFDVAGEMLYKETPDVQERFKNAVKIGGIFGTFLGGAVSIAEGLKSEDEAGAVQEAAAVLDPEQAQQPQTAQEPLGSTQPQEAAPVEAAVSPLSEATTKALESARLEPQGVGLPPSEKLVEVTPNTPEHTFAQEWMNQRGMKAVFLADSEGKPLPFRGMTLGDTVYFDASLPPQEIKRQVVYHEGVHALDEPVKAELIGAIKAVDPQGFQHAETRIRPHYGSELSGEEATAYHAEILTDWISDAHANPAKLQAIIEHDPGLWTRLVDALKVTFRRMGLTDALTSFESLVGDLKAADPKAAAQAAQAYVKAFDTMLARPTVAPEREPLAVPASWPKSPQSQAAEEAAPTKHTASSVQRELGVGYADASMIATERNAAQGIRPITPDAKFSTVSPQDERAHFDVPDFDITDQAKTWLANRFHRVEQIEKAAGRPDDVTHAETIMHGLVKQDAEYAQKQFMLPAEQIARAAKIPLEQSTFTGGRLDRISLGDFNRYLAAPARNAALAGNSTVDPITKRPIKFGIESNPASGVDSLGVPLTSSYALAMQQKALKGEHGKSYARIAEIVRDMNDWKMRRLVESGVETQETVDAWRAKYGDYWSSFKDDLDESAQGAAVSLQTRGKTYRSAKGRLSLGGNPWELAIKDIADVISKTRRNEVGQQVGALVRDLPELGRVVPRGAELKAINDRIDAINEELALDEKAPNAQALRMERADLLTKSRAPTPRETKAGQVFTYRENGQDVDILFNDKELAAAVKGLKTEDLPAFFKFVQPFAGFFRKTITKWDPTFAARNSLRDAGFAGSSLYLQHGPKVAAGALQRIPKSMIAMAQHEAGAGPSRGTLKYRKYIAEAFANGADVGRPEWREIEQAFRSLGEDASVTDRASSFIETKSPSQLKTLARALGHINAAVENATRLAVYAEVRESGGSIRNAVEAYRRTTIDWARQGTESNWIGSLWPFAPASMKGTARMLEVVRTAPKHRLLKLAGGMYAAGFFASWLSRTLSDEWDDESAWSKSRRGMLKFGKWSAGLPLPWGFNLLYYAGVLSADMIHGDTSATEATANMAKAAIDAFDPIGIPSSDAPGRQTAMQTLSEGLVGAMPAVVRPVAEVVANTDYTGGPVYPKSDYTPTHQQAWRSTGEAYKAFAIMLNRLGGGSPHVDSKYLSLSPAAMEHMVRGYTGGIGTLFDRMLDIGQKINAGDMQGISANEIPLLNTLLRESPRGATGQKYAEITQEIKDAKGRFLDSEQTSADFTLMGFAKAKAKVDQALGSLRDQLDATTDPAQRHIIEDQIREIQKTVTSRVKQAAKETHVP